jgi:hypothetical protein
LKFELVVFFVVMISLAPVIASRLSVGLDLSFLNQSQRFRLVVVAPFAPSSETEMQRVEEGTRRGETGRAGAGLSALLA